MDAKKGVVRAANIVGQKYIRQQVIEAIRSKKYRSILQKLSTSERIFVGLRFDRATLKSMLTPEEAGSMDNFLQRMKELGVIVTDDDEGPGCYRLASYIMSIYLFLTFSAPGKPSA